MITKRMNIKGDVRCSHCGKYCQAGHKCVVVLDYLGVPYLDKYYCSERHYKKAAFWEHKPFKFSNESLRKWTG